MPTRSTSALYTFGSPKVGNDTFALALGEASRGRTPIFRVVHHDDMVTAVPRNLDARETLRSGDYRHVGYRGDGEESMQVWITDDRVAIATFVPHVAWNVADHDLTAGYLPVLAKHARLRRELR